MPLFSVLASCDEASGKKHTRIESERAALNKKGRTVVLLELRIRLIRHFLIRLIALVLFQLSGEFDLGLAFSLPAGCNISSPELITDVSQLRRELCSLFKILNGAVNVTLLKLRLSELEVSITKTRIRLDHFSH